MEGLKSHVEGLRMRGSGHQGLCVKRFGDVSGRRAAWRGISRSGK